METCCCMLTILFKTMMIATRACESCLLSVATGDVGNGWAGAKSMEASENSGKVEW